MARLIADAIRPVNDYPGTFADSLTPHAARFGLRKGDGLGLLRWFLDMTGDPERGRWIDEARSHVDRTAGVNNVTAGDRYATPAAFRRALTDRLRTTAREGKWTLQQLQRQVAYDRLIERLYLIDEGWIVRGRPLFSPATLVCEEVSTSTSIAKRQARWQRTNCGAQLPPTSATGSDSRLAVE